MAENGQATLGVTAVAQPMNMPRNVCIPKRLAHWQLFRALPAEYPVNTEVEARERASTDDSYDEQQGKY